MLRLCFVSLIVTTIISCQKKTDSPTNISKKFNITVGDKYVDSSEQKWVFFTDKNGVSSEAYQLTSNTSMSIDVPASYNEGDKFILNVLAYNSYFNNIEINTFNMESLTDLVPGDYKLKKDSVYAIPSQISNHFMKVNKVPVTNNLSIGSFGKDVTGSESSYYPGNWWDMRTSFSGETTDITYYGLFQNQWKYITVYGAANNQVTEVDFSAMKPMENYVRFKFNTGYVAKCNTYGINNKDYLRKVTLNSSPNSMTAVDSLVYYYPNTSFDEYMTSVALSTNTMMQTEYSLGNTVAKNFTGWNGRVLSSKVQNGTLTTELSEDADLLACYSSQFNLLNGRQFNFNWLLITSGEKNKSIKLPVFPSQLAAQHPEWSGHTPLFNIITAVKTNAEDAYNNYLSNRLTKDVSPMASFFYPGYQRVVVHRQIVAN